MESPPKNDADVDSGVPAANRDAKYEEYTARC